MEVLRCKVGCACRIESQAGGRGLWVLSLELCGAGPGSAPPGLGVYTQGTAGSHTSADEGAGRGAWGRAIAGS